MTDDRFVRREYPSQLRLTTPLRMSVGVSPAPNTDAPLHDQNPNKDFSYHIVKTAKWRWYLCAAIQKDAPHQYLPAYYKGIMRQL